MVDQEIIDLPNDTGIAFDDTQFVPMQVTVNDARRRTWADIFLAVPGVLPEAFTWAASDEDTPLITGIRYVTEAGLSTRTISQVKLSVKNAPTGAILIVDIEKETGVNTNSFATIFSSLPQIALTEYFNASNGTFSDTTWNLNRRLRISITQTDSNGIASGLKVTLA